MQNNDITIPAKQASVHILDKVLVWCIIMGASLAKWYTIPGISLGDILVACILIILIIRLFMGNFSLKKYRSLLYVALLWFWAFGGALFLINASPFYFSEEEFAKSFLKLSFYGIATVFLVSYFRKVPSDITRNLLLNVLMLNALIAVYIYLVIDFELSLPYKFFWFNQPEHLISSTYYRATGIVVARGIFNEPSFLGIFQNLGLAYLFFSHNSKLKLLDWKYLIIIFSILLTLSYAAYSLLVLNLFLLIRGKKFYLGTVINLLLLIALITVIVILIHPSILEEVIVSRTFKMLNGMDDSSNARILGSWEPALKFIKDSPFFAAGLGNFDIAQISIDSPFRYMVGEQQQGWNIFAYILGTLGVVGFGIFILFIADLIIHAYPAGIVFVATMFASGNFLDPSFWIFYCLFRTQSSVMKWNWGKEAIYCLRLHG